VAQEACSTSSGKPAIDFLRLSQTVLKLLLGR